MSGDGHPIVAAVYDWVMGAFERAVGQNWRQDLLQGCHGRVLDLGCGTGANFTVWHGMSGLEVHAAEPDPHMRKRALQRAAQLGLELQLVSAAAEALPYPDEHFDCVATTLVLCSVQDPARSLAEVTRVLKPGGEIRFIEHVRAHGPMDRWQDRLNPLWTRVAGGCHLNRETGSSITAHFTGVTWQDVPAGFPVGRILLGRGYKR